VDECVDDVAVALLVLVRIRMIRKVLRVHVHVVQPPVQPVHVQDDKPLVGPCEVAYSVPAQGVRTHRIVT
jgi:hypothetical protein